VSHPQEDAEPDSPSSDSQPPQFPDRSPSAPLPILIRATNGKSKENRKKKIRIATVVQPDDLEEFFAKYAELCRTGMTGLKKRDRRKAKQKKKGGKDGEKKA
jgi:signal recognition particle subunit SRP14